MDFFKRIERLAHKHYKNLGAFYIGAAVVLVVAGGFVASGTTERLGQLFSLDTISPRSLTADVLPCSWFGDCSQPSQTIYGLTANTTSIAPGQPVTLTWSAYTLTYGVYYRSCLQGYPYPYYNCSLTGVGAVGTQCVPTPDTTQTSCTYDAYGNPSCTTTTTPGNSCPNFYSAAPAGTAVVYPVVTTTYSFCAAYYSGTPCPSVTVSVAQPLPAAPVLTIDAGAGPGVARTVAAGTAVTITTTATPGSGDTITSSSIVDNASNAVPGINTAVPPTGKSYIFTPAVAGSYVFYPSVKTASYPAWSNYGKSVMINVTAGPPGADVCTDIPGTQPAVPSGCTGPTPSPSGLCVPSGKTFDGTACVPVAACTGAHQLGTPPNCTCEVGYQMQGGVCVQVMCPGAHEVNWPTCSCAAGYERDAASSTCIRQPLLSIKVNGLDSTRVRKGNSVAVTWSATGVVAGSCRVTTNAGATIGSSDAGSASPTVNNQTVYRLTCSNDAGGSVSKEATVNLIPEVIEQ